MNSATRSKLQNVAVALVATFALGGVVPPAAAQSVHTELSFGSNGFGSYNYDFGSGSFADFTISAQFHDRWESSAWWDWYVVNNISSNCAASPLCGTTAPPLSNVTFTTTWNLTDFANSRNLLPGDSFNWGAGQESRPGAPGFSFAAGGVTSFWFESNGGIAYVGNSFATDIPAHDYSNRFLTASGTVTITPIPEPETYAMLLAGLGLLAFAARRGKSKGTVAS